MPPKKDPAPPPVLPEGLLRNLANKGSEIDSRELLISLTRIWGGPDKLALDIKREFDSSAKGGMTRQRILEMLQRLIINNTEREQTNIVRPTDMTTEDLARTALAYLEKIKAGPPQTGTTDAAD